MTADVLAELQMEAHVMVSMLICEIRNRMVSFISGERRAYEMRIVKHKEEN